MQSFNAKNLFYWELWMAILLATAVTQDDQTEKIALRFLANIEEFQNTPSDIVFLLDSSDGVGVDKWPLEVDFVRQVSTLFTVSFNTSRVAIVTYSSADKIYTRIDHITEPTNKNKCTLLGKLEVTLSYTGGGNFISDALTRAKYLIDNGRDFVPKLVILLTAGHSNGGDPVPIATEMEESLISIFVIGLGVGIDENELIRIASDDNAYLLNQFDEISDLAAQLKGDVIDSDPWDRDIDSSVCSVLCDDYGASGLSCCDEKAHCSCATNSGNIECACAEGHSGSGLNGECTKCAFGTYKDEYGNQDCTLCPSHSMTTNQGSTSKSECVCEEGYTGNPAKGIPCEVPIKFCNRNACKSEPRRECKRKRTVTVIGIVTDIEAVGATDVRVHITVNTWLQTPFNGQEPSTLSLLVSNASKGDCFCPADLTLNMKSLIYLRQNRNGVVKLAIKSNIQQIDDNFDELSFCKAMECCSCKFQCKPGYALRGINITTCQKETEEVLCEDIEPPVFINCPQNIEAKTDPLNNTAEVTWPPLIVEDNSGNNVHPREERIPKTTGQKFSIGTTYVKFAVADANNNEATCSFSVTVIDNEPPVFKNCPQNIEANTDPLENKTLVTWPSLIVQDNSGYHVLKERIPDTTGQIFSIGTTLVKFVVADANNNEATCSFNVTVIDIEPPVFINCPQNIEANTDPLENKALVTWPSLIVQDNSGYHVLKGRIPDTTGQMFSIGTTLVKFVVADANNNEATCSFNVTVIDNEPPVFINCPQNIEANTDPLENKKLVTWPSLIVQDNSGYLVLKERIPDTGQMFSIGTTLVKFVVADPNNNEATCSFNVTVIELNACSDKFNQCQNGADCEAGEVFGEYRCRCVYGWAGKNCDVPYPNECAGLSSCSDDGTPVCGTNHKTYLSYCDLLDSVCNGVDVYVTVRYEGKCGYPSQCLWEGQEYKYGRAVMGECHNMCICGGGRNRWYCNPCPDPRDSNCGSRSCPDYGVYCDFLRPLGTDGCELLNCECVQYELYIYLYNLQIFSDEFRAAQSPQDGSGDN